MWRHCPVSTLVPLSLWWAQGVRTLRCGLVIDRRAQYKRVSKLVTLGIVQLKTEGEWENAGDCWNMPERSPAGSH